MSPFPLGFPCPVKNDACSIGALSSIRPLTPSHYRLLSEELFRAQDLKGDGMLDEDELVELNQAVAGVHDITKIIMEAYLLFVLPCAPIHLPHAPIPSPIPHYSPSPLWRFVFCIFLYKRVWA